MCVCCVVSARYVQQPHIEYFGEAKIKSNIYTKFDLISRVFPNAVPIVKSLIFFSQSTPIQGGSPIDGVGHTSRTWGTIWTNEMRNGTKDKTNKNYVSVFVCCMHNQHIDHKIILLKMIAAPFGTTTKNKISVVFILGAATTTAGFSELCHVSSSVKVLVVVSV